MHDSDRPVRKTILLGAEGCQECQDRQLPYVREPTDEEKVAWFEAHPDGNDLQVDSNNRPYWLRTIDLSHPTCPQKVRVRVSQLVRTIHLEY